MPTDQSVPVTNAKELLKVERQIAKISTILLELRKKREQLLDQIGAARG